MSEIFVKVFNLDSMCNKPVITTVLNGNCVLYYKLHPEVGKTSRNLNILSLSIKGNAETKHIEMLM